MAIKRKKKNGRIYLEEYKSIRIAGKVKSIYIRSLGPENPIAGPKQPKLKVLDRLEHGSSYRTGDVTILWELATKLDFINIIDRICCQESYIEGASPGKFLTVWAINRAVDPDSCTQLERWVTTTDLPMLTGIRPQLFTKNAFLSSLDFVCHHDRASNHLVDHTTTIDDKLYQRWRHEHPLPHGDKETVAYDLTSVLFFGVTCPLAELAYNPKKIKRRQVNLALLVSKRDKYPITHFVYNGKRNTTSTVKNLITRLQDITIEKGTIVWDRGNVSEEHVKNIESSGWKLICGVPKISNEACDIIGNTDIPINPTTFVHKSRSDHIYAVKLRGELFGRERSIVVYVNQDQRIKKINALNEVLSEIGKELNDLSEKGKKRSEAQLHKNIDAIVGKWKDYIHTRVKRKGGVPRIEWNYKKQKIKSMERSCNKYLLLSTNESLSAENVVKTYFEKDFIEKVFRTLKTDEEIEPVRHRLEHRVRAYIFVCVLAYRLRAYLQYLLQKRCGCEDTWEQIDPFLKDLGRIERVQVRLGHQVKTWYLNVSKKIQKKLDKIGFKNIFKESVDVDFKL